jgi:hypothetical protein
MLLCASCTLCKKKNNTPHFSSYVEKLFSTEEDFFRGISMGMSRDKVKSKEEIRPVSEESNLLRYEIIYPKDSTTYEEYADIEYNFTDSDKLDIITGKIYASEAQLSDSIYSDVSRYLTYNYGIAEKDAYNYEVWKGKSMNYAGDSISINIGIIKKQIDDEYLIIYEIMQE